MRSGARLMLSFFIGYQIFALFIILDLIQTICNLLHMNLLGKHIASYRV